MNPYFVKEEIYIPISERDESQIWMAKIGYSTIIENIPPHRKVYIDSNLVSEYEISDRESERIAIIYLYLNGVFKNQKAVAKAWGLHKNTVNNYLAAYRENGIKGLSNSLYQPEKTRGTASKKECKKNFSSPVCRQIDINAYLSNDTEPEVFNENIVMDVPKLQGAASYNLDIKVKENVISNEVKKTEISTEEQEEDSLLSIDETETKYGGVILFIPFINELFGSVFESLRSLGNQAHQKIIDTITMFIFCILLGYTCPETTKSLRRKDLGVLLNKDLAFCCKTYREHLNLLSDNSISKILRKELAINCVKKGYVQLGTIYVDGHFIPYYGSKKVYKGYSTQRRLAMPGHYQNWSNDCNGRPIFFRVDNSFVKFTEAIINAVTDIKMLMMECGINEPIIVVFDRGGYDSKLFLKLDKIGVGFITWKKGHKDIDISLFNDYVSYTARNGEVVQYKYYKNCKEIKNYRKDVETIVILDEKTNKQVTIINNLKQVEIVDKDDSFVVSRIDSRWVQENFFKEAKVKEDIDHNFGYQFDDTLLETEGLEHLVKNPDYVELQSSKRNLKKRLERLLGLKGAILSTFEKLKVKKSIEKFLSQKKNREIIEECDKVQNDLIAINEKLKTTEPQIPYKEVEKDKTKVVFNTQRITSILSITSAVFNIRKRFEDICKECFKDHRELSKFVLQITNTRAKVIVKNESIHYKLECLETPYYQRAAEKLVVKINAMDMSVLNSNNKKILIEFQAKESNKNHK